MDQPILSPSWAAFAPLSVPLLYAIAALTLPKRRYTLYATAATLLAVVAAARTSLLWFSNDDAALVAVVKTGWPALARLDVITATVLPLISLVALSIVRFSSRYLQGDAGQRRYMRWLFATLASASTLVVQNNLFLLATAWVLTSLTLHQLLTYYSERPLAVLAAHKKFIASRVADVCVFSAFGLIGAQADSLELHVIHAWSEAQASFAPSITLASVLLAAGAALKCAQLPFHGWLLQVMEAPTPVSALLHAGIVNMGGVLMMRFAPLMQRMDLAQSLLVVIGTATAVAASLVMMTRVSIKVSLAWSTCAQMGFMLMQCGLGAYELALLHLLAHSLYKAHSFLSSGSVVASYRVASLTQVRASAPSITRMLAATMITLVSVSLMAQLFEVRVAESPALIVPCVTLALAMAWLLARANSVRATAQLGLAATLVSSLYFAWHVLFGQAFGQPADSATLAPRVAFALFGVLALSALQLALLRTPDSKLARILHARLFAGFYLDELFTRAVFALWPPKRLPRTANVCNVPVPYTQES